MINHMRNHMIFFYRGELESVPETSDNVVSAIKSSTGSTVCNYTETLLIFEEITRKVRNN